MHTLTHRSQLYPIFILTLLLLLETTGEMGLLEETTFAKFSNIKYFWLDFILTFSVLKIQIR